MARAKHHNKFRIKLAAYALLSLSAGIGLLVLKHEIQIPELLEHPKFYDIQESVKNNNRVVIFGSSSSGKTTLALRIADTFQLNLGYDVWYFDIGISTTEDTIKLGVRILDRAIKTKKLLLILDDLQTNMDMSKNIIIFSRLFQGLIFGDRLKILCTS